MATEHNGGDGESGGISKSQRVQRIADIRQSIIIMFPVHE